MEFLRRLRIIWTVLCLICAALMYIAHTGNPQYISAFLVIPFVIAAFSFHVAGSWKRKISILWFGGPVLGMLIQASTYTAKASDGPAIIGMLIGTWVVAATLLWLFNGLKHKQ